MNRFVVISGCSGGGKSSLLAKLREYGYAAIEEPGRRIISEEIEHGGEAVPWIDPKAFARRAIVLSLADRDEAACHTVGTVFFDRGLIDAAAALAHLTGEPIPCDLSAKHRYCRRVFLTPPWPEIYVNDPERRHGFQAAVEEYERLLRAYPSLDYEVVIVPRAPVTERARFVLDRLDLPGGSNSPS